MGLLYDHIHERWKNTLRPCVVYQGESYTWGKLSALVENRVSDLSSDAFPYLYQSPSNFELLVTLLACSRNGTIFFPLSRYRTPHEVGEWRDFLLRGEWPTTLGGVLFCTSGTTSGPKLIYQSEENLLDNARRSALDQQFHDGMSVGAFLTLAHSGGLNMQVLPALWSGCTLVLEDRFTFQGWLESSARVETCTLVPSQIFEILRRANFIKLNRMKSLLTGSMIVPKEVFDWAHEIGLELLSVYGLTEIGPYVARTREYVEGGLSLLGDVHPDFQFEIRDEEIFLKGSSQSSQVNLREGQFHLEKPTWIATGDKGFAQGTRLFFLGRKKREINFSGLKYSPEEVEIVVQNLPDVRRCALVCRPSSTHGQVGVLYIVGDITRERLRELLKERLASYKIPREIYWVDELPHTDLYKPAYQFIHGE